jgi:alpha-tubulin suppressor-like RCC1 family protein
VTGLPSGVTAITAGNSFGYGGSSGSSYTCALTTAGGVKCWGSNGSGQLGDTTTTTRLAPVDVVGLAGGVTAISSGGYHTCALVTAGGVKCWGRNSDGQLGDTTTTTRLAPVEVAGLAGGVTAISSGGYHTCALTTTGGVKCWGDNVYGQLGNNATTNRLTLADVTGLASGVAAVAAGRDYSCALNMVGGAKCWGYNYLGMLGDNSTTTRLVPVDVKGLSSGVAAVALGNTHTCALTTMGGVKCWGWNLYGQLGDNSTTQRLTPVDVTGLASGVTAIAAGDNHTCALSTAGGVKCWGDNSRGQLGDNSTTQRMTPTDVAGLASGVTAIAAGIWHTCALTTAGRVKCWGWNGWGQLGDDSTTDRLTPVDVTGLSSGVVAISAGWYHTCALTIAGGAKCWGSNIFGQVGDNSTTTRLTPVGVTGLASGVAAIAAGGGNTCALTMAGGVRCWGLNVYAQVGDHSLANRLTPVDVTGLASSVKAIDLGDFHTCALTTAGGVKCWGANRSGQLGDNTQTQMQSTPVDVLIIGPAGPPSLPTILSIVAGGGSATINFAPPSNNGGSPISGYTATCTANGQATQSANGSSSPITVRNLTVGVVYQCTVSATNGDGFTSGASTSLPVTPRKKSSLTPILLLLLH